MTDFSSTPVEKIVSTCSENAAAIAECLNQCFDVTHELAPGEPVDWSAEETPEGLDGPGLIVCCQVGDQSLLCAIPESLPLPAWYTDPGDSERARLDTLAMEWSMNLLPPDLECTVFTSTACANLSEAISKAGPVESASLLPLIVGEDQNKLWMLWPVASPIESEVQEDESAATQTAEHASPPPAQAPTAQAPQPAAPPAFDPLARIRNLHVPVIVKLAERRIEVEELLRLGPGALITFDKPCEDLLELMVNDKLYARGEAVKIGEKFGIKISEVGYVPQRAPRILN